MTSDVPRIESHDNVINIDDPVAITRVYRRMWQDLAVDWKNPNYSEIVRARMARLKWMREDKSRVAFLRAHYRDAPWGFISDWGYTYDPRNAERDLPTVIPFVLFRSK